MSGAAETRPPATSKKSVMEDHVTSILPDGEIPIYDREFTADEKILAALGYKPEFKREFSLWTIFCVSFAVMGLLPSFAATLYFVSRSRRIPIGTISNVDGKGMGFAGTPGMVWGGLLQWRSSNAWPWAWRSYARRCRPVGALLCFSRECDRQPRILWTQLTTP